MIQLFKRGRPLFQDVVSSRRRAGYLGMGRTGDALVYEFPPTKWGMSRSPRGAPWRERTGCPVGKMVAVVAAVVVE